ncbi:alanine racemase [Idiomarina seosinensis]|nr:alanine racemase [Idiomarina seosinensis]
MSNNKPPMNYRKTRAEINTAALKHNLRWVRAASGSASILGVVKADGYGHGIKPVCDALEHEVDAFAVGFTDEALALRAACPASKHSVLILEGCQTAEELKLCVDKNFSTVVHCLQQLELLEQASLKQPLDIWLKIDTGMHRLGIATDQADLFVKRLEASSNVASVTLMSHLANADTGLPLNHFQRQQYEAIKRTYPEHRRSLHNSAALLNPQLRGEPESKDWVRSGLLMYGVNPSELTEIQKELIPVMSLKAPIIAIHDLKKGDSVGYGSQWTAAADTRIATVAIGYADGYPRQCMNGTPTFVNGQRASLVGRVSMDMITIDITHIDDVAMGDDVELWGENIDVREVARCADTISWHLLTGTSVRVPRVVKG